VLGLGLSLGLGLWGILLVPSTGDSICILALGSGERLLYSSNRVRRANPVSVRVRVMVSASLSSAAFESPVLIESRLMARCNVTAAVKS